MKIQRSKVGICSDIHLGLHQASPMWHNIAIDFAHWFKDEMLSRGVKDIIIPGDVLHDRNEIPVPTLHYLPQFFEILKPFNIIITVGNHDCYYNNRSDVHSLLSLQGWDNITIIDQLTTFVAYDKNIAFCPWHTAVSDIPESDIIFGHFDIQTFKMAGTRICDHGVNSQDLLKKAPLIITGHYHATQHRKYEHGEILYTGSPYEHNWGEANTPKGVYTLDLKNSELEFIENVISPKHKRIRLSELVNVGRLTKGIKKEFEHNIIKFVIDIDTPQAQTDALISKFSSLAPLEFTVEYENAPIYTIDEIKLEGLGVNVQDNIVQFVKTLEIDNKHDICEYLLNIYKRAEGLIKT